MLYKKRIIIILALFVISHVYLISIMVTPYTGITTIEDKDGNQIIEKIHQDDGWTKNTTLSTGDIILEIDGKNKDYPNFSAKYGEEIKVERNEEVKVFTMTQIQILDILQELLIPSIFSILTFLLSTIIYKKDNCVAYYLIVFLLSAAVSFFASSESGRGDLIANAIVSIGMSLGALFLTKFIYALFLEKKIIQREMSRVLQINTFLCLIVILVDLVNSKFNFIDTLITGDIILLYFCLNIVFVILFLSYVYITDRTSIHKVFLKWLIFINIGAFIPFILLHAVPFILNVPYLKDDVAALFLFIIPLGYFYLVMSNQLLDINFITNQISYYALISSGPAIFITFVIINETFYIDNRFLYFIFVLIFIITVNICLLFLKEKVDFTFRNQVLSKQNHLTEQLEQFTQKLTACMKKDDLKTLLISQIQNTLAPEVIAIVTFNSQSSEYELDYIHQENQHFIILDRIRVTIQNDKNGDLLEYKEYLGIRIYQTDCTKTYLWIGYKKNQTSFNIHEKIWVINIVKYLRLVYENLTAVEKMIESIENSKSRYDSSSITLSRFLFQLSENERRRLASDLHDSALQDQILWYRKLEHLLKENENMPKANLEQLIKIKNGMSDVINQIRYTCNELRPNLLFELGLVQSLNSLCAQMQLKANFTLNYEFSSILDDVEDYNIKTCIYRVLQELLNNADKHAEASQVYIYMWEDIDNIYLDYWDNGLGFNVSNMHSNPHQMGLAGLKERIMSINGQIEITSEAGNGLKVYITLPR